MLDAARPAIAQASEGSLNGTARRAEDDEPIAFALVRLMPEQPAQPAAARQTITAADGRWFFPQVAAGDYRVQLARIGYRPVLSPLLHVRTGAATQHEIRATTEAIPLAVVTVRSEPACLTADRLDAEPLIAALWSEAGQGVEIRRAFEQRYHFARERRQDIHTRWRFRRATDRVRRDTLVNNPDSVLVSDRRRRIERQTEGYMKPGTFLIAIPDKDLLDEEFLRDHCLLTTIERSDGALGLRFRPVRVHKDFVDVRGTIWVEADSYSMRRLAFDWLRGDRDLGLSTIDYGDVTVDGRSIRLPARGTVSVDPDGMAGALIRDATATLTYTYLGFAQIPPR